MRPMQPRRTRRARERAFTLIELMVVVAIIAIMAATLLPIVTQPFITERRAEAVREMAAIEEGIFGRPEIGDFGYLGTMGKFPATLGDLVTQGAQAAPSIANGVAVGWQGPYLRVATNQPLSDPWGKPYLLTPNGANAGNVQQQFYIQSFGPDGTQDTSDDIYFPLNKTTWWKSVVETLDIDIGMVSGPAIEPIPSTATVTLRYIPGNGSLANFPTLSNPSAGHYQAVSTTAARLMYGMYLLTVDLGGGNVSNRQIVATKPVSSARVLVPASTTPFVSRSCGVSPAGACINPPISLNVMAGQVVDATFTGAWHAVGAGQCTAALRIWNDPLAGVQIENPAVGGTWGATSTTSTAAFTTLTLTRAEQITSAATLTPMLYLRASAGATNCIIDSGSLTLRTWKP